MPHKHLVILKINCIFWNLQISGDKTPERQLTDLEREIQQINLEHQQRVQQLDEEWRRKVDQQQAEGCNRPKSPKWKNVYGWTRSQMEQQPKRQQHLAKDIQQKRTQHQAHIDSPAKDRPGKGGLASRPTKTSQQQRQETVNRLYFTDIGEKKNKYLMYKNDFLSSTRRN